jgi:hypothetical protein
MIGGGIPLWVMTLAFGIIDVFYLSERPGMFFPHPGFCLYGIFLRSWTQKRRGLGRMDEQGVSMGHRIYLVRKRKLPPEGPVKQEVFYNTRGHQPFKKTSNLTQQRIDEILDKINLKGYERLTEEEKELLRRASEEDL